MSSKNRKDNTGFEIKQLLIGSEGTLGIITKINMLCVPKENNKNILFLRVKDYDQVLKLEKIAKRTLGRNLSALEFMDSFSFGIVTERLEGLYNPFNT